MKMLTLYHPNHGLCAQSVIWGANNEAKIRHDWKMKYGKKFKECTVALLRDRDESKNEPLIKNISNGEKYYSKKEANKATGISIPAIDRQLYKKNRIGYPYFLKFA